MEENKKQSMIEKVQKSGTVIQIFKDDKIKNRIKTLLPKYLNADRFFLIAYNCVRRTPKLLQCTQESVLNALMTLSQYGIEPDGRRAHLIPFYNSKAAQYECQLVIDYKGIVDIIMRTGIVKSICADVVCESDEFETDRGEVIKHKIKWGQDRGKPIAAWCIIRLNNNSEHHEIMSWQDILSIRDRSKSYLASAKSGIKSPWDTDEFEMAKKTVFKRAAKWINWSADVREIIEADDDLVLDIEEPIIAEKQEEKKESQKEEKTEEKTELPDVILEKEFGEYKQQAIEWAIEKKMIKDPAEINNIDQSALKTIVSNKGIIIAKANIK